jgi:hypothetical protein
MLAWHADHKPKLVFDAVHVRVDEADPSAGENASVAKEEEDGEEEEEDITETGANAMETDADGAGGLGAPQSIGSARPGGFGSLRAEADVAASDLKGHAPSEPRHVLPQHSIYDTSATMVRLPRCGFFLASTGRTHTPVGLL